MTSLNHKSINQHTEKMSLVLHTGPMFSGKTEALIDVYGCHPKGTVFVVKPKLDTRDGADIVASHDGRWIPAVCLEKLCDIQLPMGTRVVCVDEGQFFVDLREGCQHLMELGMMVFVAALNGTSSQQPWSSVSEIIPLVTDIRMHLSICGHCNDEEAPYTWRKPSAKGDTVLIGGSEHYKPACFKCLHC